MMKQPYRIGVDLGGTKLAVGIVDSGGKIVGETVTYDHKGLTEQKVLDCIDRNIDAALSAAGSSRINV
jgi:predicted NBD/HSP70 family sugar kinase